MYNASGASSITPPSREEEARSFFREQLRSAEVPVTSAEVLHELMHAYLPVNRLETLDAALELARGRTGTTPRR